MGEGATLFHERPMQDTADNEPFITSLVSGRQTSTSEGIRKHRRLDTESDYRLLERSPC